MATKSKVLLKEKQEVVCIHCGKKITNTNTQLYKSNTSLIPQFAEQRFPVCRGCVNDMFELYKTRYKDEGLALKLICHHMDWYFSEELYASLKSNPKFSIGFYNSRLNGGQYRGNNFVNNIYDEYKIQPESPLAEAKHDYEESIAFFGKGFEPEDYDFLDTQYEDWTSTHESKDKAQKEIFKTICYAQLNVRNAQTGIEQKDATKTFLDLLGSANLKPVQKSGDTLVEKNTLGTLIKKWEDEKPIPEPDPEWEDVDGIRKYIQVYFLGHLCKMLKIKNQYSRMYDEEMDKFTVNQPEYIDEEESDFESVYGGELEDE